MKKLLYLFLMFLILLGPISSCNNQEVASADLFRGKLSFYIEYVNVDGINILQNDSHIEVYYEKNGVAEKVQRSNLDYPNGFTITTQRDASRDGSDELCVKVFPSDNLNDENISTTYIKFGNNQSDTVQCQFYISSNIIYLLKTWHNGILVLDRQTALSSPLIQITK